MYSSKTRVVRALYLVWDGPITFIYIFYLVVLVALVAFDGGGLGCGGGGLGGGGFGGGGAGGSTYLSAAISTSVYV